MGIGLVVRKRRGFFGTLEETELYENWPTLEERSVRRSAQTQRKACEQELPPSQLKNSQRFTKIFLWSKYNIEMFAIIMAYKNEFLKQTVYKVCVAISFQEYDIKTAAQCTPNQADNKRPYLKNQNQSHYKALVLQKLVWLFSVLGFLCLAAGLAMSARPGHII